RHIDELTSGGRVRLPPIRPRLKIGMEDVRARHVPKLTHASDGRFDFGELVF
ncbi:MAG: hypothetical protein QOI93_5488, partial [Rhodospirillaceae bacterium]|nr:hypothetical protein [Rhodospirillaceae bacterium]